MWTPLAYKFCSIAMYEHYKKRVRLRYYTNQHHRCRTCEVGTRGGGSLSPSPFAASSGTRAAIASNTRCTARGRAKYHRPRCRRSSIVARTVAAVDITVPRHNNPQKVFHKSRRRRRRWVTSASLLMIRIHRNDKASSTGGKTSTIEY